MPKLRKSLFQKNGGFYFGIKKIKKFMTLSLLKNIGNLKCKKLGLSKSTVSERVKNLEKKYKKENFVN